MEFNEDVFKDIVDGTYSNSSMFDEIEVQESIMDENKDLYDAFDKVKKVLEGPARYNEIQTVAPAIDVNAGHIIIIGTTKHDVKTDAQNLNQGDDQHTNNALTDDIIQKYADDLSEVVPDNLDVKLDISDDNMDRMGKKQFVIVISRKG